MGTKANPSTFDCWSKLDPDEPHFVLAAHDVLAANLVRLWAHRRQAMIDDGTKPATDQPQVDEALRCADEIDGWRIQHGKAIRGDEPS
jgi:hypothetical protein